MGICNYPDYLGYPDVKSSKLSHYLDYPVISTSSYLDYPVSWIFKSNITNSNNSKKLKNQLSSLLSGSDIQLFHHLWKDNFNFQLSLSHSIRHSKKNFHKIHQKKPLS